MQYFNSNFNSESCNLIPALPSSDPLFDPSRDVEQNLVPGLSFLVLRNVKEMSTSMTTG